MAVQLNPTIIGVGIGVIVSLIVIVFMRARRNGEKKEKETKSSPTPVQKVEAPKVRVEETTPIVEAKPSSSSSPQQSQQWPDVEPAVAEAKLKKRRSSRKKQVDPDAAIIELFEKGKKGGGVVGAMKKSDSKTKLSKSSTKPSSPVPLYDDDDEEQSDDEVVQTSKPATAPSAPAPAPAAAAGASSVTEKETESKGKKAKKAKDEIPAVPVKSDLDLGLPAPTEADYLTERYFVAATTADGWAVVEDKRKVKQTKKAVQDTTESAADAAVEPAVAESAALDNVADVSASPLPVIDIVKNQLVVEASKVGLIVGPRGSTLKALQDASGVEIITPRIRDLPENRETTTVIVYLVGPGEKVGSVIKAIEELCAKGYTAFLEGPDFSETTVSIHPSSALDVVGKSGSSRRIVQEQLGVRIIVPTPTTTNRSADQPNIKVTIAGPRMKVSEAKKHVKELVKYHHSEITHPGQIHLEMDVPQSMYNCIIGTKGNEIRQIQNSYKVAVFLPNDHSLVKNVLVVGEPANVQKAQAHIIKLVEQANRDRVAAGAVSEAWAGASAATPVTATVNSSSPSDSLLLPGISNSLDPMTAAPWIADLVEPPGVLSRGTGAGAPAGVSGGWGATSAEGW